MALGSGNRFLIFVVFLFTVIASSAVTASFMKSGISDDALGEKVAQFIIENPEVVANSLRRAQKVESDRLAREAEKSISTKLSEIENDPATPSIGTGKSGVTVVEFFDYNCGYCKKVADDVARLAKENPEVKIVMKEFPILGPGSERAARAGMAAYKMDKSKYAKFHFDLLHAGARDEASILKVAEKAGYDVAKLKKEMDSEEVTKQLEKHRQLAQAIGVRGTPTFIVNGTLQRGAMDYATMKELVETAEKNKK